MKKRNTQKQGMGIILCVMILAFTAAPAAFASGHGYARNIIFMVPDGMGLSNVTAARIFVNGIAGEPLYMEQLDRVGYQRTYSRNQTITDSAPAASAWACGQKFNDGEICFHAEGEANPPTILELAKRTGKATGLVATSTITHATPAAFGAHVQKRACEYEIGRQYIMETQPDVILGGGFNKFSAAGYNAACGVNAGDLTQLAVSYGYKYVNSRDQMLTAASDARRRQVSKVLGLFSLEGMTPECQRADTPYGNPNSADSLKCTATPVTTTEPRLSEMTKVALNILDNDKDGFFLVVEGSQIDWANHANAFEYQLGESLAFDDAVKTVLDWMNEKPWRKHETLLIVVADHDCGGFAVNGPYGAGKLVTKGKIVPGWTSKDHTGVDTIIWSQGPNSEKLAKGALENTYLYSVMKEAMRIY